MDVDVVPGGRVEVGPGRLIGAREADVPGFAVRPFASGIGSVDRCGDAEGAVSAGGAACLRCFKQPLRGVVFVRYSGLRGAFGGVGVHGNLLSGD
eukprot:6144496-Heterocapsa_arctica.AAC.1